MRNLAPFFALLLALGCAPDETGYINDGDVYYSSTAESLMGGEPEVTIAGVPGAASPGAEIVATNMSAGQEGDPVFINADGSFVVRVVGNLDDTLELLLTASGIEALGEAPPDFDPMRFELANDLAAAAPGACDGCGPLLSFPDETGYVAPILAEFATPAESYLMFNNITNSVNLWEPAGLGVLADSGDEVCFFSVDGPGLGTSAIACENVQ